ncbi:hypothetical protein MLD38_027095 [Melastoma candidum]|uniref:Uncharacterized protein n=1 Tax=Melastoma candidum TaxID=119954 RepID=A0ACB9P200_9MYRT|nr:hypothetical protein MLD38_027095 [Melastoma candidum]
MSSADRNPDTHPLHPIPMPLIKTETDPYPTTFVQADRAAFKQVVQFLTGSPETSKQASDTIRAWLLDRISKGVAHPPRQGSKLYERRNSNLSNRLVLNTVAHRAAYGKNNGGPSQATPKVLSPSTLEFPRLAISPVTPLVGDLFNKPSPYSEAEKAIAEKKFYLHPSPRTTTQGEPKLLLLFPSPRD